MIVSDRTTKTVKPMGTNDNLPPAARIHTSRRSGLWSVLLVGAVGCGNGTPQPRFPPGSAEVQGRQAAATSEVFRADTAQEPEEDEPMADVREHHRHHHYGGFATFIAMSLDMLGTPAGSAPGTAAARPDQRAAIIEIQTEMFAKMQPAHDAEKEVLSMLADGIAAGKIDRARVDAAIAQLSAVAAGVHDAVADSLNRLHAILTRAQRAALIDKVDAQYQVWIEVNSPDLVEPDAQGGQLGRLATELGLSPDQVEKIQASFQSSMISVPALDQKAGAEHLRAFDRAFAGDAFDAKTLPTGAAVNAHIAAWGATRMASFCEAVAPVLTPDQRDRLANSVRRHANYKRSPTGT